MVESGSLILAYNAQDKLKILQKTQFIHTLYHTHFLLSVLGISPKPSSYLSPPFNDAIPFLAQDLSPPGQSSTFLSSH